MKERVPPLLSNKMNYSIKFTTSSNQFLGGNPRREEDGCMQFRYSSENPRIQVSLSKMCSLNVENTKVRTENTFTKKKYLPFIYYLRFSIFIR